MKKLLLLFFLLSINIASVMGQPPLHKIQGIVLDELSRKPLEGINIYIIGENKGGTTDNEGKFTIDNLPPGIYRFQASAIGYTTTTTPEYILSNKDLFISIEMEEMLTELESVTVTVSPFRRNPESPVSMRVIVLQEIEKSPGANRDISRIVQAYPGVAFSPTGYRNDLIVRGGSPAENRYYLDGIEIPNINHFSTQGASGGPVGIINADLIREVKFYTGSYPVDKGNALSSILDFKLRDGDLQTNSIKASLGAAEVSLSSNGHIGSKTSYLASVRQSYLQFLFDALGLPFLPTFTDAQFKIKTRFDSNNELTILGLGGIDDMSLNTKDKKEENEYILGYLPKIKQETFTVGAVFRHYAGSHMQSALLSHSYLNNRNTKYRDNDESSPENLMLRLRSVEQETKFKVENTSTLHNWKIKYGINLDYSQYENKSLQKAYTNAVQTFDYDTDLNIFRWGVFGSANYTSSNNRFTASLGIRSDANTYSSTMSNPLKQLSPRLSLSYDLADNLSLSSNAGIYYQLPAYTSLGFRNNEGILVNKDKLRFMEVGQGSLGLSWRKGNALEISLEGFYKNYDKIPLSITDDIPLSCKGNDYGVIGNELLTSTAQGRSYGTELLIKWFVAKKLNLSSSLTLFKSEYRNDKDSRYIASAWDNRFIFNLRGTYNLPKDWSIGVKVSCIGGAPYTPYDLEKSSLVSAWNAQGKPYYDYSKYNQKRLPTYGQVDVRVDKTFYLGLYAIGFYIDLQNITVSKQKVPDVPISTGIIENPNAPLAQQHYKMKWMNRTSGVLLPTLGITFEY